MTIQKEETEGSGLGYHAISGCIWVTVPAWSPTSELFSPWLQPVLIACVLILTVDLEEL